MHRPGKGRFFFHNQRSKCDHFIGAREVGLFVNVWGTDERRGLYLRNCLPDRHSVPDFPFFAIDLV
jgi:hypothetical protein